MAEKVTDPTKVVTDPVLLSALAKQGIDKDYVEFVQDYAPAYINGKKVKGQSPYAKFYRDLKSNKRFAVISGLPMVDADGVKIEVGWRVSGINYFSEKNNLFRSKVQGTQVTITIRNDQPDGRKAENKLTFQPQLFLNGIEQNPSAPELLLVDPVNANYLENTLEWDYGICKRRLRIIEGGLLGSWVFASKPSGKIRIKYNQVGDFRLRLGKFRVNDDEEIIQSEDFDLLAKYEGYPVAINDSSTFYPDADAETTSVDGGIEYYLDNQTWATVHDASAGHDAYPSAASGYVISIGTGSASNWLSIIRSFFLFDTSALLDIAVISAATLSIYGVAKEDSNSASPTINIYASLPASNTNLVVGDYDQVATTAFATAITYANWNAAGYNDFTLNAAGIAAISKTGVSKFGAREASYDAPNSAPTRNGNELWSRLGVRYAEQGDGFKPKLVITHTIDTTVTPGTASLATTLYTPSIILGTVVTPGTLALTLTTYTPSIILDTVVTPGTYKIDVDWNNDGDFIDQYDDITADIKSIHFSRGKSDELGKAEVGQCSVTLNNANGKYTPEYGGVISALLKPKRPIRIRANQSGTTYNLFYGFIEEITPHPHLTEQDCIITAVDGLDFLSRHDMATALYKDALTGTIHGYILDDAGWSATMRTIDAGQTTVPYWYGSDVKARFAQDEIDNSEPGFSYVNGAGYFCFEDRSHRALHTTSSATFDNTMANITYSLTSKNIYNIVKVTVTPWTLITPAVELWRLQEAPSVPVGGTYTMWGEASVSGTPVFVDTWTTLDDGDTDFTVTGGTATATQTNFAKTIKIIVTNTGATPITITLLKARGTYYDDQTKVTLKAENIPSQTAYQKRTLVVDGKYMTTNDTARDFTDFLLSRYREPQPEVTITLQNQDSATLTQILSLEISDRITAKNTKLNLNQDFFIDYMEHNIYMGGLLHTATYRLIPGTNEDMWVWDVSVWDTSTKWGY